MMIAALTALFQVLACLGYGLIVLRLSKLDRELEAPLALGLSFAVGTGVLGWLIFPIGVAGYLDQISMIVVLASGLIGLMTIRRYPWPTWEPAGSQIAGLGLALILILVLGFDFAEALTPPADADSLAYHFNNPKLFIQAGSIIFIEQAFDGAVPLLLQMIYIPVLALGGEQAMLFWTMLSGWAVAWLLYLICRDYLDRGWSAAVALLYLTVPAVVFAGGTGHVETRLGLFVLVAAWAISRSLEDGGLRFVFLAGLAVGFYAGAKYLGLFFALASGLVLLLRRGWLVRGVVFSAVTLLAGFQWYYWNALHTGDPVFPLLFDWLGHENLDWWSQDHNARKKAQYFGTEIGTPQNLLWMIAYPFKATLNALPTFESRRIGFGPYGLIVLPFTAMAVWKFRDAVLRHRLFAYALIALLFYGIWFIWGPSQRIRHLLPVLPLFLIVTMVAVERITRNQPYRGPLVAGIALTLFLQLGGHGLFSLKYFRYLAGDLTRAEYLSEAVVNYSPVPWINANLKKSHRILTVERQIIYHLEIPYLFASGVGQGLVNMDAAQTDPMRLYDSLEKAKITHLLVERVSKTRGAPYFPPIELLNEAGCLERLKSFGSKRFESRTLPTKSISNVLIYDVVRLKDRRCLKKRAATTP